MAKLVDFADSRFQCWSKVELDNGDPIHVNIAQSGVLIKKSRLGFMGPKLFLERDVGKAGKTAMNIAQSIDSYSTPDGMDNPVLRAFTQAALNCTTAAELTSMLALARDKPL